MIPVLYGPTASGKSALALDWAMNRNGTIVNADSLQVYNALPILTAQPDESETTQAPHELYGYADPLTPMSAAAWAEDAGAVLNRVAAPILVGGTGLYIKTLINGIAPIPDSDPAIRARVETQYAEMGSEAFHAALRRIDPIAADGIEPNNAQRLKRAMEVFIQTKIRFSDWHKEPKKRFVPDDADIRLIVFLPDREWIRDRSKRRVEIMIERGVLDEVRAFGTVHGVDNPATKALGFAPLWEYCQGRQSLDESIQQTVNDTSAYIKRQLTWGRNQLGGMDRAVMVTTPSEVAVALETNHS